MDKFCSEEEFLEVVVSGKKEVFDEILSRVFQKAVESAILYLPEAVDKLGKRLAYTTKVFGEFIEKHPEYREHKDLVVHTMQKLELESPNKNIEEILASSVAVIDREIKLLKDMKVSLANG